MPRFTKWELPSGARRSGNLEPVDRIDLCQVIIHDLIATFDQSPDQILLGFRIVDLSGFDHCPYSFIAETHYGAGCPEGILHFHLVEGRVRIIRLPFMWFEISGFETAD